MSEIARLEARLSRPEQDENGFDSKEHISRIDALRALHEQVPPPRPGTVDCVPSGGINTHVHTGKSFGCFASPAAAVWAARQAGLRVFGINDHYTLRGHAEFREACEVVGICPTFSMEAIALWPEALAAGETVNDPSNAGRTYFTAKGVTRDFPAGCRGKQDLARMNRALLERHQQMVAELGRTIEERLGIESSISMQDVLALTPHGQPTERHLAKAAAAFLQGRFTDGRALKDAVGMLCQGTLDSVQLEDEAALQGHLRAELLKAGKPAYVAESDDAFVPLERLIGLSLDLGAIPTYPVLGNPVTPWEEDIPRLFDRLEALGVFAVEVIPDRNERERLADIVETAEQRGLPVFNGTEHNTPVCTPLVDRWFFDGAFRPCFEHGARVLIAHQDLCARGEPGWPDAIRDASRDERSRELSRMESIGEEILRSRFKEGR